MPSPPLSSDERLTAGRPSPKRVLVAGYKPFLSYGTNPAEEVARALNGTCVTTFVGEGAARGGGGATTTAATASRCFEGWLLDVDRAGASRVLAASMFVHELDGSVGDSRSFVVSPR